MLLKGIDFSFLQKKYLNGKKKQLENPLVT